MALNFYLILQENLLVAILVACDHEHRLSFRKKEKALFCPTLEFQVIAIEFLIKQILQPAGTPPFLQNLVASPVRHAELEHKDHWYYTVDRKRL